MADNDDLELGSEGHASGDVARGSGNHPVRKRIAIKLKPAGKEKTRSKSRKDASQRRVLENDGGDRPIDEIQFSSMVSVGLNEPIHKHSKLNWNHRVNLIGDKVVDPLIHNCEKCSLPILIYGRMIPCKHVFCYSCSKKTDKNCPRCNTPVVRIEQSALGTVFVCTYGGAKHGVSGCHRTYLSHRDLQSHMTHRHLSRQEPAAAGRQHDTAQIGPTAQQQKTGGDQAGQQVHHVQVPMGVPVQQTMPPPIDYQGHTMQVHPSAMQFNPNQPPPQLQHDPNLIYLQVMQQQQQQPQVMQQQGLQQPQKMQTQGMPSQGMQLQGMQPPPVMQQQGMQPQQGIQGQGMQPTQQGRQQPGIQPQGMQSSQGMQQQQGMMPQGMPQTGMQPQGLQPHGMQQHGMQQQGIPQQGIPQQAMQQQQGLQQQQGMQPPQGMQQSQTMPPHGISGMPPPQGLHLQVMPPQGMMLGPPHMSTHLAGPPQRGMQLQGLPPPGMQAPPQIQMIVHQGGQAPGAPGSLQMMTHQGGPPQDVSGGQQMITHPGGPGGMMNPRTTNLISVQLQDESAYRRGEMGRGGQAPPHHEGQQMYVNQGGAPVAGQLFINPGSQQNPAGGVSASYSSGAPHSGPLMSPASHHVLTRPPQAGGGGQPQPRPGGPPPMNVHGGPPQQHVSYSPRQYEEHMSAGGGGAPPRMNWNQPGSGGAREQSPQQRFSPQTGPPPGNMGPPRFYQQ